MPVTQLVTSVGRAARPFPTYYTMNNAQNNWNTNPNPYPFDGTSYAFTGSLGSLSTLSINIWFRPSSTNTILLNEQDSTTESTSYHYTMMEINSSGYLYSRIWDGSGNIRLTSSGFVNLNQWNHVYFQYSSSTLSVNLNNSGASSISVTRQAPTETFIGVGPSDGTYMVTSNRYQGELGALDISSTTAGSNYLTTKAEYGL